MPHFFPPHPGSQLLTKNLHIKFANLMCKFFFFCPTCSGLPIYIVSIWCWYLCLLYPRLDPIRQSRNRTAGLLVFSCTCSFAVIWSSSFYCDVWVASPVGAPLGADKSMHHEEASSADYSTKALYLIVKWKGAEIGLPARKMRGKILLADSKGPHWKRCTTNCNIFILTKIVVK